MKFFIIVDAQNDFVTGSLANKEAQIAVPKIREKILSLDKNTEIYFTKDTHMENYLETFEGQRLPVEHCIAQTEGWEIVPELAEFATKDNTFRKRTFGSVNLYEELIWKAEETNIEEIEFCGFCTDICVISNVLAARMALPHVPIKVDARLCAGVTPEKHAAALEVMKSCQIDVIEEEE